MKYQLWPEWAQGVSRGFVKEPSHVSVLNIYIYTVTFVQDKVAILGMEELGGGEEPS